MSSAIRPCSDADFDAMLAVVNAAATAHAGAIPADRYHEPYMPAGELRHEIEAGVRFWGWFDGDRPAGLMGIQDVDDVTLIRHAYVAPEHQRRGVGADLLTYLRGLAVRPLLVGTWAGAWWAIRFYERQGFRLVTPAEKDTLLRRYWDIPERQIETSVVLRIPSASGAARGDRRSAAAAAPPDRARGRARAVGSRESARSPGLNTSLQRAYSALY